MALRRSWRVLAPLRHTAHAERRSNSRPHSGRVAILFDAENIPSRILTTIFDELDRKLPDMTITEKRAYGDFSMVNMDQWRTAALSHGIETRMHASPNKRKNASDIALSIDAMDILHDGNGVDTFVLVTNDSDFAPLAQRLRRQGVRVVAVGGHFNNLSACVDLSIKIDFTQKNLSLKSDDKHTAADVAILQNLTFDKGLGTANNWIDINSLALYVDLMDRRDWRKTAMADFVNFRHMLDSEPYSTVVELRSRRVNVGHVETQVRLKASAFAATRLERQKKKQHDEKMVEDALATKKQAVRATVLAAEEEAARLRVEEEEQQRPWWSRLWKALTKNGDDANDTTTTTTATNNDPAPPPRGGKKHQRRGAQTPPALETTTQAVVQLASSSPTPPIVVATNPTPVLPLEKGAPPGEGKPVSRRQRREKKHAKGATTKGGAAAASPVDTKVLKNNNVDDDDDDDDDEKEEEVEVHKASPRHSWVDVETTVADSVKSVEEERTDDAEHIAGVLKSLVAKPRLKNSPIWPAEKAPEGDGWVHLHQLGCELDSRTDDEESRGRAWRIEEMRRLGGSLRTMIANVKYSEAVEMDQIRRDKSHVDTFVRARPAP